MIKKENKIKKELQDFWRLSRRIFDFNKLQSGLVVTPIIADITIKVASHTNKTKQLYTHNNITEESYLPSKCHIQREKT